MTLVGRELTLVCFDDSFYKQYSSICQSSLRSKSRGGILLLELIKQMKDKISFNQDTAVYHSCMAGPLILSAFEGISNLNEDDKYMKVNKQLPPKQYFVQNMGMKSAMIPVEFGFNGQWTSFCSQPFGLQQAFEQAFFDIEQGIVPAALISNAFFLDSNFEFFPYSDFSTTLIEGCGIFYFDKQSDLSVLPSLEYGSYGPLTSFME